MRLTKEREADIRKYGDLFVENAPRAIKELLAELDAVRTERAKFLELEKDWELFRFENWAELLKSTTSQRDALLEACREMAKALNTIENECACDTPEVCFDIAKDTLVSTRMHLEDSGIKL